MKLCVLICGFLLVVKTSYCEAQLRMVTIKAPHQRILYTRQLPSAIRKQMPLEATSCFAGFVKPASTAPALFLHLYHKSPKAGSTLSDRQSHFTIDLFENRKIKGKAYRLINRFLLEHFVTPEQFRPQFGAQFLWLDPKQRTKPIIKLDLFSFGDYGPMGTNIVVVFPKGLSGQPIVQKFGFGSWSASHTSGQHNTFQVDKESGLLEISTQEFLTNSEIPTPVVWRWTGEKFAQEPTVEKGAVPPPSRG